MPSRSEIGFRKVEGALVHIKRIIGVDDDQNKALRLSRNILIAFYIEGFANDLLSRHLNLNSDTEAKVFRRANTQYGNEPKTVSKLRVVMEKNEP